MDTKKYVIETLKYLLRSYPFIRPYIKEIDNLYELDEVSLHKRNEERFLEIFRTAYDKSKFYHKFYSDHGIKKEDIKTLSDINKLPVVTKEMVKEYADEMLTVPRFLVIAGHTSGTTGTPLCIYESWPSIWRSQAYTYCARKRNGFTYGQRLVSLRGNLDKRQTYLKVHVSNTLYLSSYNINKETVGLYYKLISEWKPVAIEGYPSSLFSLALFLKDADLKLQIPVAFTSSETLLEHQRELIEERFGTEVFDNYGMTEQTIYLQEAYNHNGYYEMPGYSINEYLEDGEICTSLINKEFPLIRYRSNDIMEMAELSESNPQIVVTRINGRKEDFIYCKDGTRIMRLGFLFKKVQHIKMSQLVQKENGSLEICIVPDSDFNSEDINQVEQNLINRVGADNIDYEIKLVTENEIVYTKRGKYKFIINMSFASSTGGDVVNKILGRTDDYIICKDGSVLTRIDFIEKGSHIDACQWIQERPGQLTINIVPDDACIQKDIDYVLTETVRKVGKDNMDITVKCIKPEDLIYSSRGKFKLIVRL